MAQSDSTPRSGDGNIVIEENVAVVGNNSPARASWAAIIAGTVCALAIYMTLGLIGVAAGIGAIDPTEASSPTAGIPTGLGLWWMASAIAAFFAGGMIAGRLAGWPTDTTGALHGLTVGAISLLLIAYISLSATASALTGAAGAVAKLFSSSEQKAVEVSISRPQQQATANSGSNNAQSSQTASNNNAQRPVRKAGTSDAQWNSTLSSYLLYQVANSIRKEADTVVNALTTERQRNRAKTAVQATFSDLIESPGDAGRDIQQFFEILLSNDGVLGETDRQAARKILVEKLDLEPGRADMILDRWQQRYEQAVDDLQALVNDAKSQLSTLAEQGEATLQKTAAKAEQAVRQVVSEEEQRKTVRAINQTVDDIVAQPSDVTAELESLLERLFGQDGVWGKEDLAEVKTLLEQQTGISERDIEKLTSRWQRRYQKAAAEANEAYEAAKQEAAETAEAGLDTMAATAGWASLALVLGLGASAMGGLLGRPNNAPVPGGEWLKRTKAFKSISERVAIRRAVDPEISEEDEPLNHRKPWTDEDVAMLRKMAGRNRTSQQIAVELRRTQEAVLAKAQENDIDL